jgi:hypothetical protein
MELKQKNNLETIKGNPFTALSIDTLNHIALDASVKIGNEKSETCKVISSLVELDKVQYDQFIDANPETLLPDNIESDSVMSLIFDNVEPVPEVLPIPVSSIEEPDTLAPWSEVVKRGRRRNEARGVNVNMVSNDWSRVEH